jgi:RNA polymerase sigma factor (sigma-70 family)
MSPQTASSSLRTNPALLFRLRDWSDRESWSAFYHLYFNFIYGFARRAGLSHADAEEVTQDVFRRTAETIHEFQSDPERGRFRGWIMTQARWRVSDKFRARHPHERPKALFSVEESGQLRGGSVERIPDSRDAGSEWEREWRKHVVEAALRRLSHRVPSKYLQIFDLYGRRNWPVLRVARELGVNPASVYAIHHRVTKILRAEVKRLEHQLY